jgi:hypothetical protein
LTVTRQVETRDKCHVSCNQNQTCLSPDSRDSSNCSTDTPESDWIVPTDVEPVRMACMWEYTCYPKIPTLDFSSNSESEDGWNSDLDYGSPESGFSSGSECSDPCEGSEGESEEYSSDEEDYTQGYRDQYQTDHSSEYSESDLDEISNIDSESCTSESDSLDPDWDEYSESERDDVYNSG